MSWVLPHRTAEIAPPPKNYRVYYFSHKYKEPHFVDIHDAASTEEARTRATEVLKAYPITITDVKDLREAPEEHHLTSSTNSVITGAKQAGRKTLPLITWADLAKALGINYNEDALEPGESASLNANEWIEEYERDADVKLGPALRDDIFFAIEQAIRDHWSLENIVRNNLDLDGLIRAVDEFGKMGPQMAIYEDAKKMATGAAIVGQEETDEGVVFTIAKPFETAYAEGAFGVLGIYHEGRTLDDFGPKDVATVMRWVSELTGPSIGLDLDRWDERRNHPKYQDLVKIVEAAPKDQVKPVESTEEVS